jgi:hypothetical protein
MWVDLVALDRVALAAKCSHVLEEAAGDFGRHLQRLHDLGPFRAADPQVNDRDLVPALNAVVAR